MRQQPLLTEVSLLDRVTDSHRDADHPCWSLLSSTLYLAHLPTSFPCEQEWPEAHARGLTTPLQRPRNTEVSFPPKSSFPALPW